MGDGRSREGWNDVSVWKELQLQAKCGFDEAVMERRGTGPIFLKYLESVTPGARMFGALVAAHEIFGPNQLYPDKSRDRALQKMQRATGVSDKELTHIIRVLAINNDGEDRHRTFVSAGDLILLEACREPMGVVRRAVSDEEGHIDLSYFRDEQIIAHNATVAFSELVDYNAREPEQARRNYKVLRAMFPEEMAAIEREPDFLLSAAVKLRNRLLYFADDRRIPAAQGRLLPPPEALHVIPSEAIGVMGHDVVREIEAWIPTIQKPVVASELEAALKGIGSDYEDKTRERAQRAIERLTAQLVELEA
jgi:hypothetical protein